MQQQASNSKVTAAFVGAAVVLCAAGWASLPRAQRGAADGAIGQKLFPTFDDPTVARRLEIIQYDEATATLKPFEVVYRGGAWQLPSFDGYPADAQQQMVDAANLLIGLDVLNVAETDSPSQHAEYGVIDPSGANLQAGTTGVGMRMNIYDESGSALAQIIVGKEVPEADGLRYVRDGAPNRDQVFIVKMDAKPISTKLEDWIEEDLLKISSWDVQQVVVNKYGVDAAITNRGLETSRIDEARYVLDYHDDDTSWTAEELSAFDPSTGQWRDVGPTDEEELNSSNLNELRRALSEFKIVDVSTKPAELSDILRSGDEQLSDPQVINTVIQPLLARGLIPVFTDSGSLELLGRNGDMTVLMNDGVEYLLRFGETAGAGEAAEATEEETAGEEGESPSGGGINRFLMVTCRFDETVLTPPELEPIPQSLDEVDPSDRSSADAVDETDESAEESADEAGADAAAEEPNESDAESGTQTVEEAELAEAQAAVQKRNEEAQAEYDQQVADATTKVDELNARFADWFFVISEDVFQRTSLSREDVVQIKSEDAAAGATAPTTGLPPGLDLGGLGEGFSLPTAGDAATSAIEAASEALGIDSSDPIEAPSEEAPSESEVGPELEAVDEANAAAEAEDEAAVEVELDAPQTEAAETPDEEVGTEPAADSAADDVEDAEIETSAETAEEEIPENG